MKTDQNTITLIISYWNGWEVYLTGTGKLGIETLLATFETIEEARVFCKAFEECGNIATVEDIPYSEVI